MALLVFQSEAVAGSAGKKGRAGSGGGCAQGKHGPGAHAGTGVHCRPARLRLSAGLAGVW